jgi:hypothetical protein
LHLKKILPFILSLLPLYLIYPTFATAGEIGIFRGRVVDNHHMPIAGAVVVITGLDQDVQLSSITDDSGTFAFAGIPPGLFSLRVEAHDFTPQEQKEIWMKPSGHISATFTLQPAGQPQSSGPDLIDWTPFSTQTTIPPHQLEHLPSAHSVWSLIENQDLSATTNRIDVGGMWETHPALFSARGGCSWTQNTYLLNGLDVTDPYWTGLPLCIPDYFSLAFTQMSNAAHPVQALHPGGYFALVPKEGTADFHGGCSGFYLDKNMTASNITPSLEKEGLFESHTFNKLTEFNVHLSGPLAGPKLRFFASATAQSIARNIADFDREDKSLLYSGLINVRYHRPNSLMKFLWTGQFIANPTAGAGRNVPFVSTTRQRNLYNILQAIWESAPRERHSLKLGLSLAQAGLNGEFQRGVLSPHKLEIFQNVSSGAAPSADRDLRSKVTAFFEGQSCYMNLLGGDHVLQYGVQAQYNTASSRTSIRENKHLYFLAGKPLEVAFFNAPVKHRESSVQLNAFVQETYAFLGRCSIAAGLHAGWTYGWNPADHIRWLHLSPRFSLSFPVSMKEESFIRITTARYYHSLPLNYLAYGNADSPGKLIYSWVDANADQTFQDGEQGILLRREGAVFARIDPEIKQPSTDEFSVSWMRGFRDGWYFTLAAFLRTTRNLVESVNTGVLPADYLAVPFFDEGDDRILGTHDDLAFVVYNQKSETLGRDFYLLTNPDAGSRTSQYKGLDLTLMKRSGSKFFFFLSLTATEAIGTTSPGNTEWENDDGVIGSLYDTPNAAINARGRLRFDRAYTGRIGTTYRLPWGIRIGAIVKYYDGQPFARKIIVQGMNQGPFFIQAHPRGVSRYEYNMTVDVRLEKEFRWERGTLRLIIDGFNIFNRNLATQENEWTGPEFPLRYATDIQSPRVFRIGANFGF